MRNRTSGRSDSLQWYCRDWNVFPLCAIAVLAYGVQAISVGRREGHREQHRLARPSRTSGSAAQRERRRRILDATIALASKGGFDAVQMRAVAERADVALGTLYRYFPSKIHLLVSALGRSSSRPTRLRRPQADPGRHRGRPGDARARPHHPRRCSATRTSPRR